MARLSLAVLLVLALAATAQASVVVSPRCLSTEGCSFTSCATEYAGGGTTYYYCDCQAGAASGCTSGSNANAGTNPALPKQTFDAAWTQMSSLNAGDRILLCKGGSFTGSGANMANFNASNANRIMLSNYAAPWNVGTEGRPLIKASGAGVNLLNFQNGGNADHNEGYVVSGLVIQGPGSAGVDGTGVGMFVYNDADYITICDVKFSGFAIGIQISTGNTPNPGANQVNEHITVRNSEISGNSSQGMLTEGSYTNIGPGDYFNGNGYSPTDLSPDRLHNLYLSPDGVGGTNQAVFNSEFYNSAHTTGVGKCQGNSIVGHGIQTGTTITGNLVHEDAGLANPGCYGIAVDFGYSSGETFTNVTIDSNVVVGLGATSIGMAGCIGCTIQNNLVVNNQGTNTQAICVPDISQGAGDATQQNTIIRNNTVWVDGGIGIQMNGVGTGHSVVNNAVQITANTGTVNCFAMGLPNASYTARDYNDCYCSGAATCRWSGSVTLAIWKGSTGADTNSITSNPLFITTGATIGTFDYGLQAGSPLIAAGLVAYAPTLDITGLTRPNPPSIGAYDVAGGGGAGGAGGAGGSGGSAGFGTVGVFGNRPLNIGAWFCLALATASIIGGLAIRRRRAAHAELAAQDQQQVIDEHTILAIQEMRQDGIEFPVNTDCKDCVEALFLPKTTRKRKG